MLTKETVINIFFLMLEVLYEHQKNSRPNLEGEGGIAASAVWCSIFISFPLWADWSAQQ